ncbi:MAG: NnrU family protein [Kordiimonadaceae bacterium]|jgi:uncharacterized membrane protein|nr:NnrU family protein [Kordiimonadaceae bacterium]
MDLLLAGVLLWSGVHFIPGFLPNLKASLVEKLGNGYRGLFSLTVVLSIVMMVFGWRASEPEMIYMLPEWSFSVTRLLMFFAFFLIGAAHAKVNIKRVIRHPMLSGVIVWSGAHLLSNGDSRSIILFGGLLIWAVIEILIINKRDGAWEKLEKMPFKNDIIAVVITFLVYTAFMFVHPYIAGVPVM